MPPSETPAPVATAGAPATPGQASTTAGLSPAGTSLGEADETASITAASAKFSAGLSVDTGETDVDSVTSSVPMSSSMSATSSVYKYPEHGGRTFHKYKEGKYPLPNDMQEQNRLDLQHVIAGRLLGGKLYLAPIDKPARVLDIGTGTGLWAREFAQQNPDSDVLGTDLSPIQPHYLPVNLRFEIDDAEDDWVYSHKFDYIHGRYLCAFLKDFPKLFRSIYDNLNPGGYVEFMEQIIDFRAVDNTLEGTHLQKWNRLLQEGIIRSGRDVMAGYRYKQWLTETGFTNITERRLAIPATPWAKGDEQKMLGVLQMHNHLEGVEGISLSVFCKALGWTVEQVTEFLPPLFKDLSNRSIHAYIPVIIIYAQKPLEPEQ